MENKTDLIVGDIQKYSAYLSQWINQVVKMSKTEGIVLGLSGGIDSSLVLALALQAGVKVLPLILPCHSAQSDQIDARELCSKFNVEPIIIDLSSTYDHFLGNISTSSPLASANLKARLRMCTLYYHANLNNYLVVGTDNWAEYYTGYFTKFGDGAADLLPLRHLRKCEVVEMARLLGVPETILNKAPSAGLIEGVTDEMELKVTYATLDKYLNEEQIEEKDEERIRYLHEISKHKRLGPYIPNNWRKE